MSQAVRITKEGRAGRICLARPEALNALTSDMVSNLHKALNRFNDDDSVDLIAMEGEGRAFCAGGDLVSIYGAALRGDVDAGRQFWADEYRLNLAIGASAKPVVTFLHGYVMGGGIGLGCHAALRIADPETVFAVSQPRIGLAPDAGSSFLLSLAPGRMGEYLGCSGKRFSAADACYLGFADRIIPRKDWGTVLGDLWATGRIDRLSVGIQANSGLTRHVADVDTHFAGETLGDIWRSLTQDDSPFAKDARDMLTSVSPLAAAAAIEMMHRLGDGKPLATALELEYRFAHRAITEGDVAEGIRALLVDRDNAPKWRHTGPDAVPAIAVSRMLQPLGNEGWFPG